MKAWKRIPTAAASEQPPDRATFRVVAVETNLDLGEIFESEEWDPGPKERH